MARDFLPRQDVQIADPSGRATTPYYVWMQSLDRAFGAIDVDLAALLAQIEQLKPGQQLAFEGAMSVTVTNVDGTITISLDGDNDSPGGNWYYGTNADGVRGFWPVADGVSGGYSITKAVDYGPYNYQGELDTPDELPYPVVVGDAYLINGDLWVGADDGGDDGAGWDNLGPPPTTTVLSLINDEATPDPTHYYGTDAAGNKGWHPVSDAVEAATGELTKDVGGDGVTTFGLPDVTPTPGGTLQRYGFDAKGRRIEEEAADTDDLAEGSANLYFTAARVRDTLLTGLSLASSAVISATDSVLSAFGKLQAQITALASSVSGLVVQTITSGDTTHAPSGDAVFDALAGKGDLAGQNSWVSQQHFLADMNRDGPAGTGRNLIYRSSGATRWSFGGNAVAEAGSNSGTNFQIRRFLDDGSGSNVLLMERSSGNVTPGNDNQQRLGGAGLRWAEIFAANGTINTSDAREKTDPRELTEAELAAAADIARLPCIFQWLHAIEEKGEGARLHCSPTVQSVIAVMEAHGLDPFRYGFVCYDEWDETPEVKDEETGEVTQEHRPAGDRYSLRPCELQFFIARGQEERLRRIEQALGL